MIKYLRVATPFEDFYRAGLQGTETAARAWAGVGFADLSPNSASALVQRMSTDNVPGWQGPPPGFFYFVLRSDAVDVMYGTQQGFALLGVPYMPHISPPSRWGE